MADLTVWKFDGSGRARDILDRLRELQEQHLIQVFDAAVVTWPTGKKKPKTEQAVPLVKIGALDGAFWGLLFGLIFLMPLFGAAFGAVAGAVSGRFRNYGINDNFIKEVRERVTEGTSALFLLTGSVTLDKVEEALSGEQATLIRSNLTEAQEAQLQEHFSVA